MKKFSKVVQLEVAKSIISGKYFVEEAMAFYGVESRRTIKRWLKMHMVEAKLQLYAEQHDVKFNIQVFEQGRSKKELAGNDRKKEMADGQKETSVTTAKQIEYLHEVIALHERIYLLESMNAELHQSRDKLINELATLKRK